MMMICINEGNNGDNLMLSDDDWWWSGTGDNNEDDIYGRWRLCCDDDGDIEQLINHFFISWIQFLLTITPKKMI